MFKTLGAIILGLLITSSAKAEFKVPVLNQTVVDLGHFFSSQEISIINGDIRQLNDSQNIQIGVVTFESLDGESLEGASIKIADAWKLGQKGSDRGVVIILTRQERGVRIEVGRGLEGDLTDAKSSRIIQYILVPAFKRGRFASGVITAIDEIGRIAGGGPESTGVRNIHQSDLNDLISPFVFMVFVGLFIFFRIAGGGGGYSRRRGGYWDDWGGGGGFGGGSWGGGGSSSWGGGGGGFSGGGSSGKW